MERGFYNQCKETIKGKLRNLAVFFFAHTIPRTIVHIMPQTMLRFEISLAEHCDLNCAYCSHFAPVAEPEFADYEEVSRDFARLSYLFHDYVQEIHLMGGEPLLHPDIIKFLKLARENFPKANIDLVTNGLKLRNQPEEFWHECRDSRITVRPTRYPIPLDYNAIKKTAKRHEVSCYYYSSDEKTKTMDRVLLDVEGRENGDYNFLICRRANWWLYLAHGKFYPCPTVPSVYHLNRHFGTKFEVLPKDYIDIYKAGSAEEILEFLSHPIPFCRYCQVRKMKYGLPWRRSEKNINEWVDSK